MNLGATLARLNRLQQSRLFKIVASVVLAAVCIGAVVSYVVSVQADANRPELVELPPEIAALKSTDPHDAAIRSSMEATAKAFNDILEKKTDWSSVAIGASIVFGLGMVVIWLGLGLSYLGLILVVALIAVPLMKFGGTYGRPAGAFLAASIALTASFAALMQALKLAFAWPNPVLAIAKNLADEAVRMKLSLVFIVLLIFAMAALPGLLHENTPLRYRVQNFLQYGTSFSFAIIAVLVLFLAVGSVAFDQRDRLVWQTMTKPVAPWQYVLGKWLGVTGVALVLIFVSTTGVFLFTEYLRSQPADGEVAAFVPKVDERGLRARITEDRRVLETQILASRDALPPDVPPVDEKALETAVREQFERERKQNPDLKETADVLVRIKIELDSERIRNYLTVGPGGSQRYRFSGLGAARESGRPLTLRYKVNSGGNDPTSQYRIAMYGEGTQFFMEQDRQTLEAQDPAAAIRYVQVVVRSVPLGQLLRVDISPAAIQEDGTLTLTIANGDPDTQVANPQSISFAPDGLVLLYSDGTYHGNFLRVMFIFWLKLAFLAMVGIWAATFLSFPVACLVSFGVLLCAEASTFLSKSLEYYDAARNPNDIEYYKVVVRAIALPIAWLFKGYGNLRPTASLVEGFRVPGLQVVTAVVTLGSIILVLYGASVLIFRRRELATYSGR